MLVVVLHLVLPEFMLLAHSCRDGVELAEVLTAQPAPRTERPHADLRPQAAPRKEKREKRKEKREKRKRKEKERERKRKRKEKERERKERERKERGRKKRRG